MKKRNLFVAAFTTLIMATGCSSQGGNTSSAAPTQAVSSTASEQESSTANADSEAAEEAVTTAAEETTEAEESTESTVTGKISDIKDFMFTITDADGKDYGFSFDGPAPEGLSSVKDGDTVTVVYTGKVEEAEAFTGTIISVTKQ